MPSWDSTPRLQNTSNIFAHTTPDLYEEWLAYVIEYSNKNLFGDERLVFINAWNEWGEGCHLEPDRKYGSKFLKATERVLEKFRSNSSITDSICGSRRL
jgi:lipopolysaccharide biosynthesis protein